MQRKGKCDSRKNKERCSIDGWIESCFTRLFIHHLSDCLYICPSINQSVSQRPSVQCFLSFNGITGHLREDIKVF